MADNFEKAALAVYKEWKKNNPVPQEHPDDELLAGYLENKLSSADKIMVQKHLAACERCAECVSLQLKVKPHLSLDVPLPLLEKVKKMAQDEAKGNLLEICLRLKDKALEIIQTSGDVLFGQELVPAPLLRSRQINEFKEEVCILKDLSQIRVWARIQNNGGRTFDLTVTVKGKDGLPVARDKDGGNIRITLIREKVELESYVNDSGSCFFENIPAANYIVEISRQEERMAVVDLKVSLV